MTMNLRFGLAEDGDNSWKRRKPLVSKLLKQYSVEFLGIQEANHFQTEFLSKTLNSHGFIGWHNRSSQQWQSNLVFFPDTWACLKSRHYFLSKTPAVESRLPGSKWPRQCVIGLFEKADQQIIFATTHFDFKESVQEKSASLVTGFLSEFPRDCPVIITGDFNANPGSKAYDVFKSNSFCEVFENQPATTFHHFTGKTTRDHLDWILYRGKVTLLKKDIILDSFSGRYPSDHYPVRAVFSMIP